jgi:hypothetical protein
MERKSSRLNRGDLTALFQNLVATQEWTVRSQQRV